MVPRSEGEFFTSGERKRIILSPSWRIGEYRFSFSSHDRNEPAHVHVESGKGAAKFWLNPLQLADNYSFSERELGKAFEAVHESEDWLIREWENFWRNA